MKDPMTRIFSILKDSKLFFFCWYDVVRGSSINDPLIIKVLPRHNSDQLLLLTLPSKDHLNMLKDSESVASFSFFSIVFVFTSGGLVIDITFFPWAQYGLSLVCIFFFQDEDPTKNKLKVWPVFLQWVNLEVWPFINKCKTFIIANHN